MINLYLQWRSKFEAMSQKELCETIKSATLALCEYWKGIYGKDAANDLVITTFYAMAGNDGAFQRSEYEVIEAGFHAENDPEGIGAFHFGYEQDAKLCQHYHGKQFLKPWREACEKIDDLEPYKALMRVLLCVAYSDGQITKDEVKTIDGICNSIAKNL